jgi:hypothetical protein
MHGSHMQYRAQPTSRFIWSAAAAAGCSTCAQSMAAVVAWQGTSQDTAVPLGSCRAQETSMPAVQSNV